MRVMCKDDSDHLGGKHPFLKFGEIYFPIGEGLNISGEDCWVLPGFPATFDVKSDKKNKLPLYLKTRFIRLDDQTEVVIEEEELATA